ncbi:MAG: hypothetical protein NTX00_01340 [Candidatus Parcubacteria bacterium]|nr:hypothetical protein [Candidatus Parcubacteria bacterium]
MEKNRRRDDGWLLQMNLLQMDLEEIENSLDEWRDQVPPDMVDKIFGKWENSISVPLPGEVWGKTSDSKPELPVKFYSEDNQLFLVATRDLTDARLWHNDQVLFYQNSWDKDTAGPIPKIFFLFLIEDPFVKQEEWRFKNGLRWEIISSPNK